MTFFKEKIGVIGITSLVGECLLPLLVADGYNVVAFSRQLSMIKNQSVKNNIDWRLLAQKYSPDVEKITKWICLAPITALPKYFLMILSHKAKHVVAVSSTSVFTKIGSSDITERNQSLEISRSESKFVDWANGNQVIWTILRPTLIYGLGRDKNVSMIIRFIRRFCFFPFLGTAGGLRQPVHAQDVALACMAALKKEKAFNRSYNICGGEILSYREMVKKIFKALEKKPHFVILPLWIFRFVIFFMRVLPPFRHWSPAMAERMNSDLVFDDHDTISELEFLPRQFILNKEDIPVKN